MSGIEISIGTKLIINGNWCVVKEGRTCSKCAIQQMTSCRTSSQGLSMKCGTKHNGNTTDFICSKNDRTDNKNIFFEKII